MLNLDTNKNYLLACSFGPDSMALFHMLLKERIHFSAALVNYHIRPESSDEMRSFIHYCEEHHISYHVKDIVNGIGDMNLESECRKIRYAFFADLVAKFKYDEVLVAHNQDDVIETYLMQKKRQNLVTFYGIKEKTIINNVIITRPLLSYSKGELLEYCQRNNVPYAIDSSNFDERYLRNKIRHQTVAKMSENDRAQILMEIEEKNRALNLLMDRVNSLDIEDTTVLMNLSDIELAIALNILIKKIDGSAFVSLKQTKEIRKNLRRVSGNAEIPVHQGIVLRRSYARIQFLKPGSIRYSFVIDKPMKYDTEYFYLDFSKDASDRNVYNEDYPLTIRNYRSGDKYTIRNYLVSVRRLFIDWKMPLSLRQRWPIILNKDGKIIYIPRYKKDFVVTDNVNFYVK